MYIIRQRGNRSVMFIREWSNGRGGMDKFYSPDGTVWFPSEKLAMAELNNTASVTKDNYTKCYFCSSLVNIGYESNRGEWSCIKCAVALNGNWLPSYGYLKFEGVKEMWCCDSGFSRLVGLCSVV